MPNWSASWWCYVILLGKNDRKGMPIGEREFSRRRKAATKALLAAIDTGVTHIKPIEAYGETKEWGIESTAVLFVLANDRAKADEVFQVRDDIWRPFAQREVWILRWNPALLAHKY